MKVLYPQKDDQDNSSSSSSSNHNDDDNNNETGLPHVPVGRLSGHDGPVLALAFVGDKYCLSGGHDRTVRLWNPFRVDPASVAVESPPLKSTTTPTTTVYNDNINDIPYRDLPPCLAIQSYQFFSHEVSALTTCCQHDAGDGVHDTLVAASDKALVVGDLVANKVQRRLRNHHTGRINAVATLPRNGNVYVSASYDSTAAIWDGRARDNHKPIQVLCDATDSLTCVLVGGGGAGGQNDSGHHQDVVIRTGSVDGNVRTYDLRKGLLTCDNMGGGEGGGESNQQGSSSAATSLPSSSSPIMSMATTHDGQCLVVSCIDGTIRLVELETGELLNTYHGSHLAGQYGLDVAVMAGDATIATGSEDGSCHLYDLVRAQPVRILSGDGPPPPPPPRENLPITTTTTFACPCLAAHPKQNSVVITASYDNSVVVWANQRSSWQHQQQQ